MPKLTNFKLEGLIEGLLFVNGEEGATISELQGILEVSKAEIKAALLQLQKHLEDQTNRGLIITKFGDHYKLTTKPEDFAYYNRLLKIKPQRLSQAALETLAIVAYKGPVTKPEIEAIRGVNCDALIAKLRNLNLIQEVGRAESPGQPILYAPTDEFLDHFNLESLMNLPPLPEFKSGQTQELYRVGDEEE